MDTIVIRLHDLKKHFWMVNQIVALTSGYMLSLNTIDVNTPVKDLLRELKEKAKEGVFIEPGEIDEIINHKYDQINSIGGFLNLKTVLFHDQNKKLNIAYRKKHKPVSSSYDLLTQVCYDRDYIEWNFSVPKFLYGNNVAQFITHPGEHFFEHTRNTWKSVKRDYYKRFIYFVRNFFEKNFVLDRSTENPSWKIDFLELELNRIDFCWNCFFRTKSEALVYLSYIQKQKPKGARRDSDIRGGLYTDGWTHTTDGYQKKVYYKGSEFKKNDRKQLEKNKVFSPEQIDLLQEMADKILRFEVTLRKQHMSYLYQTNIFRKDSRIMNEMRTAAKEGRKYHELKTSKPAEYRKLVQEREAFDSSGKRSGFTFSHSKEILEKIKVYKLVESCNNYRRDFVFGQSKEVDFYNENHHDFTFTKKNGNKMEIVLEKKVCLNEDIFMLWLSFFEDFVKETEVKFLPSFDSLQNKIVKHNEIVDNWRTTFTKEDLDAMTKGNGVARKNKKLQVKRIIRHLALLQKYTVKELRDYEMVDRTTLWRLEKDLKQFNIDLKYGMGSDQERTPIEPDYLFEWREVDPDNSSLSRLIREPGGFRIYNLYMLTHNLFSNRTYA
jgi:hypothetical protein